MSLLTAAFIQFSMALLNIPGMRDNRNSLRLFSFLVFVFCFGLGVRSLFLHFGA